MCIVQTLYCLRKILTKTRFYCNLLSSIMWNDFLTLQTPVLFMFAEIFASILSIKLEMDIWEIQKILLTSMRQGLRDHLIKLFLSFLQNPWVLQWWFRTPVRHSWKKGHSSSLLLPFSSSLSSCLIPKHMCSLTWEYYFYTNV